MWHAIIYRNKPACLAIVPSENFIPKISTRLKIPSQVRPVLHNDHPEGGGGRGRVAEVSRPFLATGTVVANIAVVGGLRGVATAVAVDFFSARGAKISPI